MKHCLALISLLLCCSYIRAQRVCPVMCPAIYSPVCGEALFGGQLVRCQFSNACVMGVSSCTKNINWTHSICDNTSPNCAALI